MDLYAVFSRRMFNFAVMKQRLFHFVLLLLLMTFGQQQEVLPWKDVTNRCLFPTRSMIMIASISLWVRHC